MGDDADGNENEERDDEDEEEEEEDGELRFIDQGNEENNCVITEVEIDSDEDEEDGHTICAFGRLAGSWLNLNN